MKISTRETCCLVFALAAGWAAAQDDQPTWESLRHDPPEWLLDAKYAGMAVVHHDGFLLWDSKINRWNAKQMGPKRDCYGEFVEALRAEGLKTIATFHHIRTFNWYLPGVGNLGGEIPEEQKQVMLGMGEWLKANGEAIYNTRPWKIAAEGDEAKLRPRKGWEFAECDGSDIRFTRSKDGRTLYAIALGWPKNGSLRINSLGMQTSVAEGGIKSVTLIDGDKPVEWTRNGLTLLLEMPKGTPEDRYAYAFRVGVEGKLQLD